MQKHTRANRISIVSRIIMPLIILTILQAGIIVGMFSINGVFDQIRENALSMLQERVQNKYQMLESQMTMNWSYLMATEEKVLNIVTETLSQNEKTFADIRYDAALNALLSKLVVNELISLTRENNTTGAFVIFNGIGVVGRKDIFAGVYIRDADPYSNSADNSDLHVLRGLPPLTREYNLSLDSFWEASFTFPGAVSNPDNAYFYMPLYAAHNGVAEESLHDGYWSLPFNINGEADSAVITYSEPLLNEAGEIYGVIGVEINESYLLSFLNKGEFARSNRGCYFLGMTTNGGKNITKAITGGTKYKQFFKAEDTVLTPKTLGDDGRITVQSTRGSEIMHGAMFNIMTYPSNTVFASQQWVLIGMEDETTLFAFERNVRTLFYIAAAIAILLGAVLSLLTGRSIVRPIIRLAASLNNSDPNETLKLETTNITEIDQLADAIISLNHDVNEAAGRLSKILGLTGLAVGVFEMREDSDVAFCSDGVFTLLGREALQRKGNMLPKAVCQDMVQAAMANQVEESIYRLQINGEERYVSIKRTHDKHATVGTVLDVTLEMEERRRIERERDHDLLTGILNRRAFENSAERLFIQGKDSLGVAAIIMLDLDNLKFLNDTYGHDCGDGYIRSFAESLRLFGTEQTLVARRSGDEFLVLIYGGKSKHEMRNLVNRVWAGILERNYMLPDGTPYRMRVSAGLAWYPDDAQTLAQLIHFADFAMYSVKRSAKGTMEEFNRKEYSEDSFLISGRDALDRLIDQQLVRFAMQPIVSAHTGDIYGYELLMRTNVRELPDPMTVLRLANAEGKLLRIERLTWMKGLETIRAMLVNNITPTNSLFFINSIANQVLTQEDERIIVEQYRDILPRLVIEVTESEKNDKACTQKKLDFVRAHGGKIAIDDYGTGYNSELALMQIDTDIVKLDISFVRGVNIDVDKQALIKNLISYAKHRSIAVLAEGVETREEMRTLVRFGVDYLQGFYLGQPQYQPAKLDKALRREIRSMIEEEDA